MQVIIIIKVESTSPQEQLAFVASNTITAKGTPISGMNIMYKRMMKNDSQRSEHVCVKRCIADVAKEFTEALVALMSLVSRRTTAAEQLRVAYKVGNIQSTFEWRC